MIPLHVRLSQNHMATTFDLTLSCARGSTQAATQTLEECHVSISRLEAELSEFRDESPVARLNRAAPFQRVPVPSSVLELLERGENLRRLTLDSFDVTAKSATSPHPRLDWDCSSGHAWRFDDGAHLGFGAIGKGYALDKAREVIERSGFTDYCLSAGGSSVILSGFNAPGVPWRWGWSWEKDSASNPLGLELTHQSGTPVCVGVSGLHEKGDHLIAPSRTVIRRGKSALVARPSAADADALSTALFVSGWEIAKTLHPTSLTALAYIDDTGTPHWNGTFQRLWGALVSILMALMWLAPEARADEEVDLSSLGMSDFTPYVFERNFIWVILPALSLLLVFWHLKKPEHRRSRSLLSEKKT